MRTISVAALFLALASGAEAQTIKAGSLTLSDLQLRATPAGVPTSAAYMTIENHGKAADTLVGITCACAASAMMHETRTRSGISAMAMLHEAAIPAGGQLRFQPNGLHVMLTGLKGPLKAGSTQTLTLTFQKAGKVKAAFRVLDVIPAR